MEQKTIALELLVRSGNPIGVEQFADSEGFDEPRKTEKMAEAGIYSATKVMWEEAEGGIDSQRICQFLNQDRFTNYFSTANNTEVLEGVVDVLQAGTHAQMEAYAQITAIDVLGVESLSGAIRRNIDAPNMREKVTKLVQSGYSLVFCPHDIDSDMVDHYFPIIDKWRDFVNPQEIVQHAIRDIVEDIAEEGEDFFNPDYSYKKDFVYKALDKLVELTDRDTVSRLVHESLGESDNYQRFVDDGKVDAYIPTQKPEESANVALNKALVKYEGYRYPSSWNVKDWAEAVGDGDKEYVAQRMGTWFQEGRMRHFTEVATYEDGRLYDHAVAKQMVGEGIAEASQAGNLTKLDWILDLPQHLIDEANPAINGVVTAYKISQQTKAQE
jgi:hypothetical protein